MKGKVVVSALSIILLVGAAIGVEARVINKYGSSIHNNSMNKFSSQMKAENTICESAMHKELCMQSLSSTVNGIADPKGLIQASVVSALNSLKDAMSFTSTINDSDSRVKMAAGDCNDMLQNAIADLQTSLSFIRKSDLQTVNDHVYDLQTWLSAVVSYQTYCVEGFLHDPNLQSQLRDNFLNATQHTGNTLAILAEIPNVAEAFGVKLINYNPNNNLTESPSRRFLSTADNYPTWFSATDRKLLAQVDKGKIAPNVVVALDGSGQFKSINAALNAYPMAQHQGRFIISVKAGIYNEYVTVGMDKVNVLIYGDGPTKTIISGNKSNNGGFSIFQSAPFSVLGKGFVAKSMGFRNTAGYQGGQAVALRVGADMSAFFNCRVDGYQDTLLLQSYRQLYRDCVITGSVDFIFGDASAVIQNSIIVVNMGAPRQPLVIAAQAKEELKENTGFVIHNCRIIPDQKLFPERFKTSTYLARAWKKYATTVFMESDLGDFILPAGYMSFVGDNTAYFAEYGNRGASADIKGRVKWAGFKGIISRQEALKWTVGSFIQGDSWLKYTGIPYLSGLLH